MNAIETYKVKGPKLSLEMEIIKHQNDIHKIKLKNSAKLMMACLNSDEFEDFVKNFSFEKTYYTGFWFWKKRKVIARVGFEECELTNDEVYARIMDGREVLDSRVDNEANIKIIVDGSWSYSAIGYTYPDTKKQYVYESFLDRATFGGLAGNISHEWMHKIDFGHAYKYHITREFTVPYAVGYFISLWVDKKIKSLSNGN